MTIALLIRAALGEPASAGIWGALADAAEEASLDTDAGCYRWIDAHPPKVVVRWYDRKTAHEYSRTLWKWRRGGMPRPIREKVPNSENLPETALATLRKAFRSLGTCPHKHPDGSSAVEGDLFNHRACSLCGWEIG